VPFLAAADNSLLHFTFFLTIKGKSSFAKNLKYNRKPEYKTVFL
jgi:hypothetical protein